tara:strand:+ start:357 stop:605 length:249 start_codon:yes stop_codon:yes gene_type:complete
LQSFYLKKESKKTHSRNFEYLCSDNINPNPIKYDNIDDPPYETKGKGNPTTGNIPITIDILIKEAKKKFETIPNPNILEKLS